MTATSADAASTDRGQTPSQGQPARNTDSVAIVDGATDLDALIFCISARTLMGELNGGNDRAEALWVRPAFRRACLELLMPPRRRRRAYRRRLGPLRAVCQYPTVVGMPKRATPP